MAKKKTSKKAAPKVTEAISGSPVMLDNVFKKVIKNVQLKMQKKGMLVGHNPLIHVLPMPALACRYLWQNEGLPIGCVYQCVGPQASYKSTFAMEMVRWHRLCGGGGFLCEAETKPTPELRNSVLNWDADAVHIEDCASQEEWQSKIVWTTKELQKQFSLKDGPGRTKPIALVVDSLTGKASEKTLQNIDEKGYAGLHFPVEAKSMADFMRAYPQKLLGWPFTFIGVNHMKLGKDENGNDAYNIPGGWALKFQCAAIVNMERMGAIKEFANYKAANISMRMFKNSYGPDNIRINVRFKTWYQNDAPADDEPIMRLHSRFEWWEASINLIAKGVGMTAARAEKMLPLLKEACDVKERNAGNLGKLYYSNRLGVSKDDAVSAHELGMMLEQQPPVLADLYTVLGIQRRPFFRPGVDFMKQLADYEYVVAQADAADDNLQRMQQLQDSLAIEPSVVASYPQQTNPMSPAEE